MVKLGVSRCARSARALRSGPELVSVTPSTRTTSCDGSTSVVGGDRSGRRTGFPKRFSRSTAVWRSIDDGRSAVKLPRLIPPAGDSLECRRSRASCRGISGGDSDEDDGDPRSPDWNINTSAGCWAARPKPAERASSPTDSLIVRILSVCRDVAVLYGCRQHFRPLKLRDTGD